jgi:hypothetical protein
MPEDIADQLAKLDDAQLLEAVNAALANRPSTVAVPWPEMTDEQFYAAMYPHADPRRGPVPLRIPDENGI